ncbi:MAG: c-type cytochrome [Bacteroidota bacterium]
METGIRHTHLLSVILFLLIYIIKTVLLLANKEEGLAKFTKAIKVPEIIISCLFLVTGIYLLTQIPEIKLLLIIKIITVFASIPVAVIGFRKKKKVLAVLSLVMIFGAFAMGEISKNQKSAAMENLSESTVNGQEIFNASCTPCHGTDGKLGLMDATDLSTSAISLSEKIEIIKNGKGSMKSFGGTLTDKQIQAVAQYSESLKN